MPQFLITALGSYGDVHPMVGLGAALVARGHRVKILTNPYFEDVVTGAGLEMIGLVELTPPTVVSSPHEATDMWEAEPEPEPFSFNFSLRSLMIAMTVAAVSLGMIHFLGGPGPTATILGAIAFVGLIALALGFAPPQPLILGWWFILLLYVLLTIAGATL